MINGLGFCCAQAAPGEAASPRAPNPRATVRRSKLYYLRDLVGKAARLKEKRVTAVPASGEQSS